MPILSFLFGPLVGAAIGGLTNRIAIRMLFRPYTARYIGKIHVPLTPGIIPHSGHHPQRKSQHCQGHWFHR